MFDFAKLDVGALRAMVQTFIVVVDGNRQNALRLRLADDIIIQDIADFLRTWHFTFLAADQAHPWFLRE